MASYVSVLRDVVEQRPDDTAIIFLFDGESDERRLTFGQLDARCHEVAARLAERIAPRDRVLIMCEPGLDYVVAFLGCLYAGAIAVPAYPPSPLLLERSMERLRAVVVNSGARHALTSPLLDAVMHDEALRPQFSDLPLTWTTVDVAAGQPAPATSDRAPAVSRAGEIAFLQYTSGSTSAPKGVVVTHGNLLANLAMMVERFRMGRECPAISWLPPYHDMGLIGAILTPLATGNRLILMSPDAFLKRPMRWLRALDRYNGYASPAPNFAFELCVRRATDQDVETLDLSSWQVAINGAEPIDVATMDRFVDRFARCGFRREAMWPSYGLAEATLLAAAGSLGVSSSVVDVDVGELRAERLVPASGAPSRRLVTCGSPTVGSRIFVLGKDEGRRELPPGEIGELAIVGDHVAEEYWNNEEESAAAFRVLPDGQRAFLTGDLGGYVGDQLVVTGRSKDMLIIRGRNHYPQDIERTVQRAHPLLRPGCGVAVSVVDDGGQDRLVVIQEVRSAELEDPDRIVSAIVSSVTEDHGVRPEAVMLIEPRTLPKTSSGKVQRIPARNALTRGRLPVVHGWRSPRCPTW